MDTIQAVSFDAELFLSFVRSEDLKRAKGRLTARELDYPGLSKIEFGSLLRLKMGIERVEEEEKLWGGSHVGDLNRGLGLHRFVIVSHDTGEEISFEIRLSIHFIWANDQRSGHIIGFLWGYELSHGEFRAVVEQMPLGVIVRGMLGIGTVDEELIEWGEDAKHGIEPHYLGKYTITVEKLED